MQQGETSFNDHVYTAHSNAGVQSRWSIIWIFYVLFSSWNFYKSLQEIHLNLFTDISINYNKTISDGGITEDFWIINVPTSNSGIIE